MDRYKERKESRQINMQKEKKKIDGQIYRKKGSRQIDMQKEKKTDKWVNIQKERKVDRQIYG